jgi:hypothetical protein
MSLSMRRDRQSDGEDYTDRGLEGLAGWRAGVVLWVDGCINEINEPVLYVKYKTDTPNTILFLRRL